MGNAPARNPPRMNKFTTPRVNSAREEPDEEEFGPTVSFMTARDKMHVDSLKHGSNRNGDHRSGPARHGHESNISTYNRKAEFRSRVPSGTGMRAALCGSDYGGGNNMADTTRGMRGRNLKRKFVCRTIDDDSERSPRVCALLLRSLIVAWITNLKTLKMTMAQMHTEQYAVSPSKERCSPRYI